MDPWLAIAGPVVGFVDSLHYSAQEQARDAVGAEMAAAQREQAAVAMQTTRDNRAIATLQADAQQRMALIIGGAAVVGVALLVLLK